MKKKLMSLITPLLQYWTAKGTLQLITSQIIVKYMTLRVTELVGVVSYTHFLSLSYEWHRGINDVTELFNTNMAV